MVQNHVLYGFASPCYLHPHSVSDSRLYHDYITSLLHDDLESSCDATLASTSLFLISPPILNYSLCLRPTYPILDLLPANLQCAACRCFGQVTYPDANVRETADNLRSTASHDEYLSLTHFLDVQTSRLGMLRLGPRIFCTSPSYTRPQNTFEVPQRCAIQFS